MLAFVGFIITPLLFLALLGWSRAYVIIGYLIFVLMVLFLSTVLGVGLTVISTPDDIRSYTLPSLWTQEYVDSLPVSGSMFGLWLIPYMFLADLFRIYVDFGVNRGGFLFWIPQLVAYFTILTPIIGEIRSR